MTVSAVIPVKNRPILIAQAITSCLGQTVAPDEIIVVDDGSDDATPDVVMEMARTEGRIRLIRRDASGGASVARNDGAARASGTWIAFLDSDDRWHEEKTARQLDLAARHPDAPAIFCGIRFAYAERKPRIGLPPPIVGPHDLAVSNVLATTSTALVRKDRFDFVNGFDVDLPTCEDWDLWLKLSKLGPLPVVQAPLVEYTYEATNKLSRDMTKLMLGHELVFARIAAEIGKGGLGRLSALHDLKRAELHIRVTGEAVKALGFIWSALSRSPSAEVLRRAAHLMGLMTAHGARL
ncbi:glycosyltransferase family 2 protein [Taklimakanibacter deserti]|uniref:glycosyltransferase family 2 protein n=1 Tax=Taklimakanibacter deserti TaxID=2267839 RepID=UPI0013C4A5B6